jgi:hypothetical protein
MMAAVRTSETSVYFNETTWWLYPGRLSSLFSPQTEPEISQLYRCLIINIITCSPIIINLAIFICEPEHTLSMVVSCLVTTHSLVGGRNPEGHNRYIHCLQNLKSHEESTLSFTCIDMFIYLFVAYFATLTKSM